MSIEYDSEDRLFDSSICHIISQVCEVASYRARHLREEPSGLEAS